MAYGVAACDGIEEHGREIIHRREYESQDEFIVRVANEYASWLIPHAENERIVTFTILMEGS